MESAKETESTELTSPIAKALRYLKVSKLSEIEVILFGFAMILGNRSSRWNIGLTYGYHSLLFNLLFAGSGYLCLCLCMGEMSSALPFSGGIFGFVRAALGPYMGFLVACSEFVYCITTIELKVQRLPNGDTMSDLTTLVATFVLCLILNLIGGRPIFTITSFLGSVICLSLFFYLFGTLGTINSNEVDYNHYAGPFLEMSWANIMGASIAAGTQYNGVQFFPLFSNYLREPREQLPRIMLFSCSLFIVFSILVTLAAVSQSPGAQALIPVDLPLNFGYSRILGLEPEMSKWIDTPCSFGAMLGLYYCCGRQLLAITKSGLLPPFLAKTTPGSDAPYITFILAAVVGSILNVFKMLSPQYVQVVRGISLIASFYIFILCLISYLVFRRKFSTMTRSFTNPLGDYAAIYGIGYFIIASIAVIFYSSINPMFLIGLGIYFILATIFFWTYLVHNQKFSEEEKKIMFKAYLINANRNMRKNNNHNNNNNNNHRFKNNKVGPNEANSTSRGSGTHMNVGSVMIRPTSFYHPKMQREDSIQDKSSIDRKEEIATNQVSRNDSFRGSQSFRKEEPVAPQSTKLSSKVIAFLSGKLGTVAPAENIAQLNDDEQLAVLAAGGIINEESQKELQKRFGIELEERRDEEVGEVEN